MADNELALDCPICGNNHTFQLTIHRITIRYFSGNYGPWYDKTFTRLFNCPEKNEKFQAEFILSESRENRIEEIEIKEK